MSEVSDPDVLKQLNDPSAAPASGDLTIPQVPGQMKIGDPYDAARGGAQGLLDPVEGLAQFAEWAAGRHLVGDDLRNWARDFRKRARSTYAGIGGEVAGNVAGMAIPASILGKLGLLGQFTSAGGQAAEAVAGGAASGLVQPVEGGGDYARAKINQGLLGAAAGPLGPKAVGYAAHALPYVLHPAGSLLHLLGRSTMPSSTLGSLAQKVAPRGYGTAAGMYEGANPPPAQRPPPSSPPPSKDDDKPDTSPHDMPEPPPAVARPQMPSDFAERARAAIGRRNAEETE